MNEVEDNKTAKRARNLAALASSKVQQKNSMLNFVKPGVSAHHTEQRKTAASKLYQSYLCYIAFKNSYNI